MVKRWGLAGAIGIVLLGGALAYWVLIPRQTHDHTHVAVVIVIDQFAYHYIPKLKPYFKFGFKTLFSQGVVFQKALHPHAAPTTATGHTALNAGTYAMNHAVILNDWFDCHGNKVKFASDDCPEAKGLSDEKSWSGKHIMADTLSDQVMLDARANNVFSISLKPRSAVALAGHRGHALWFDSACGGFTSSKAFFRQLPAWVIAFNASCNFDREHYPEWPLAYPASSKAYDFPFIDNYDYAATKIRLAGEKIPLEDIVKKDKDDDETENEQVKVLMKTPHANKLVLDCAENCIKATYNRDATGKLLVWVSLSSLDKIGHLYGPDSREVIDMLYHLDRQLGDFIEHVQRIVGDSKVFFALTGDHGVARIPELAQLAGQKNARRVLSYELIDAMNQLIAKKYGIQGIVRAFKVNQFFLNKQQLESLNSDQKKRILADLKAFLMAQPGIKKVWTFDELSVATFTPDSLESYYKNQRYQGRSGDLICMPEFGCALSKYTTGTVHRTPYDYDTHVPLVLYQKGVIAHADCRSPILTFQLPVTLAKIFGVDWPEKGAGPALL